MSNEEQVREASRQFYGALNRMANGDAGAMAGVWMHDSGVTTMHPIGGRQVGWDEVLASFAQVAKMASAGRIELTDQLVRVAGSLAYELGVERGQFKLAGHEVHLEHRVTNVYRNDAGTWKIVHHHTDTSPSMLDVLNRL